MCFAAAKSTKPRRIRSWPWEMLPTRIRAVQARDCRLQTSVRGRIVRGIADLSGDRPQDLPQTREEVEEIGKIVGPDAVILLAKDATETAFKKEPLDQFRVLHLAVHGFADTQYPERSALVLGDRPKIWR